MNRFVESHSARRLYAWAASTILLIGAAIGSLLVSTAVAETAPPVPPIRVPLAEGRRLVRMMDDIYRAGVITTHRMYVRDPGTPAAVAWGKQVMRQVQGRGWPEARIFAAVDRPLNPENAPQDGFEREAIAAFRAGKGRFEKYSHRELRYASEIRILDQSCVVCHVRAKTGDLVGGVSYRALLTGEIAAHGQSEGGVR